MSTLRAWRKEIKDQIRKLSENSIFLIILPAIVFISAYLIEAGYFSASGADISFMEIDYQVLIESIPYIGLFFVFFYVLYSLTDLLIVYKPRYSEYYRSKFGRWFEFGIPILKFTLVSAFHFWIIYGLSETFSTNFFSLLNDYFIAAYLITYLAWFVFSTDLISFILQRKVPKDIWRNFAKSVNAFVVLFIVCLSLFFMGEKRYDPKKIMTTNYEGNSYDVIRVYQNELLLGDIKYDKGGYRGYIVVRSSDPKIYKN